MRVQKERAERERRAWLGLALVPEIAPSTARRLIERFGSAAAVLSAGTAALEAAGCSAEQIGAFARADTLAAVEAVGLARLAARAVLWPDPDYPARLRPIAEPPLALMVQGAWQEGDVAVAIVGARRASAYGTRVAEDLARGLAQAGVVVVSGLATGIDAAAHRGALAAGGRTVAVLGTGLGQCYPPWHRELAAAVAGQGALVTEFAFDTPPLQFHFPRRNRIISGLTVGTVVVEAAERSGSLLTARSALEQGREVFAVPGPIGVSLHAGPHRLIQQGAKLVTRVEDILDEIAPTLAPRLIAARAAAAVQALDPVERRVLDALGPAGDGVDDVIRRAALAPAAGLETLLAPELRGLVEQQPGKRFRRKAA